MKDAVPSFQPEGIDFGTLGVLKFPVETEHTYVVCSYVTNKALEGDFGICLFQEKGEPVSCVVAKQWSHVEKMDSEWKGDSAFGSVIGALSKNLNPKFTVSVEHSGNIFLMIAQRTKDVSAIVFDEKRIMPTKFYIGMHVLDEKGEIVAQSEKWHNSKDVYLYVNLESKKKYTVIPSTRNKDEEIEFTLSIHGHSKVTLKRSKD